MKMKGVEGPCRCDATRSRDPTKTIGSPSYPIRRLCNHRRGIDFVWDGVSDYVEFDYSGDGNKCNLTRTLNAVK